MAISLRDFKSRNERELFVRGVKGATRARIIGFLSKSRRKAFTASEIYGGAGYKGKGKPSGDFYSQLNQLVRERKVVRKGSYFIVR